MKLSKKTWTIIAIVGVIILIYWLMTRQKSDNNKESGFNGSRRTRGSSDGINTKQIEYCGCANDCFAGATGGSSGNPCARIRSFPGEPDQCLPCPKKVVDVPIINAGRFMGAGVKYICIDKETGLYKGECSDKLDSSCINNNGECRMVLRTLEDPKKFSTTKPNIF